MSPPADVLDLLTLLLTTGVGPQRVAALLERFGSAAAALRASPAELSDVPGVGAKIASALRDPEPRRQAVAEIERATKTGATLLARGSPGYPEWLANVPAAPPILFVRGQIIAGDERAVALVGTRNPTPAGRRITQQLAEALVRAGVTVVSGLARGIDGIAHRAALDAGGRTLAVLAGGLGRLYPPEHKGLAEGVVRAGAVVTESATEQEPLRGLFPARNRIISGLSKVVVIVQAGADSGALITAGHAAEQGRHVLAVPGAVDDEQHAGCNRLIRDGAILCRHADDVLEELDGVGAVVMRQQQPQQQRSQCPGAAAAAPAPAGPPPGLDETQKRIWDFLAAGPRAGDEIAQHLGLGVAPLAAVLLGLELRKVIRRLPGNRFER
jgi:DNA processing protein